jgi:acyl phosphate:glycerol-3-phosphate acyltransferase
MPFLIGLVVLLASYLLGSIPSGLIITRLSTGKDVRTIESGRTGGTNVMRAAGVWAGLATAFFDMLKAVAAVRLAHALVPANFWLHTVAPLLAILGHNYSLFLVERKEDGRLHFRGGAGGASCVGGSVGFWAPSFFILVPLAGLIFYFIGYASLATLSVSIISTVIFAYRAWMGISPWQYTVYGLVAFILLSWSLRPNIKRLLNGTERLVGYRLKRQQRNTHKNPPPTSEED